MRATWLTDLHLDFLSEEDCRAWLDMVKVTERPDILLVTGDTAEAPHLLKYLSDLATYVASPVYYVLGNHDFYRADVAFVRDAAKNFNAWDRPVKWLQHLGPTQVTDHVVLVGVDGWADGRTGDPEGSTIGLRDWKLIQDLRLHSKKERLAVMRKLADADATTLRKSLKRVPPNTRQIFVLTHVPPFPEACWYDGKISDANWSPWFTCVATGKVLAKYAHENPSRDIIVLCGHTHGIGTYRHAANLEVRTGGWPKGVQDYGNPIVQHTFEWY